MIRYARSSVISPTFRKSSLRDRSLAFFAFNGGAYAENEKTHGLHHFMEHLMFRNWMHVEATATRKSVKFNAVTDDDRVYFYITGLSDGVEAVLNELDFHRSGFAKMPTKAAFDIERNVLLQEFDSMRTHRPSVLITSIQARYFNYFSPFGRRKVLERVTYREMSEHVHWFERPSSILLVGGAGIKYDVASLPMRVNELNVPDNPPLAGLDDIELMDECGMSSETIICDFMHGEGLSDVDMVLLKALWSDGNDSPIHYVIREENGLAYSANVLYDRPCHSLFAYVTTSPKTVTKVRKLLRELFMNPERYITRKRFDEVKEMMLTRRRLLRSNTCSLGYASDLTSPMRIPQHRVESLTYADAVRVTDAVRQRRFVRCSFGESLRLGGV